MAEVARLREGRYSITEIGAVSLDNIEIDSEFNRVWIDTYTKAQDTPDYYPESSIMSTYGWISADDAEIIALAILDAVARARQSDHPIY
jgi:hypothetical protein